MHFAPIAYKKYILIKLFRKRYLKFISFKILSQFLVSGYFIPHKITHHPYRLGMIYFLTFHQMYIPMETNTHYSNNQDRNKHFYHLLCSNPKYNSDVH